MVCWARNEAEGSGPRPEARTRRITRCTFRSPIKTQSPTSAAIPKSKRSRPILLMEVHLRAVNLAASGCLSAVCPLARSYLPPGAHAPRHISWSPPTWPACPSTQSQFVAVVAPTAIAAFCRGVVHHHAVNASRCSRHLRDRLGSIRRPARPSGRTGFAASYAPFVLHTAGVNNGSLGSDT